MSFIFQKKSMPDREAILRDRLGIPKEAARILIFAESSHWDPNWLYKSEQYFDRFVHQNLDKALTELQQEPRRVYSIECMFFFRMYWERSKEKQKTIRKLINEGQLRLTGSGVTTSDTLLPSVEALLRDWLIGQEWLRTNGMNPEPKLSYFTDSFGASPFLPSLLRATGFDRTAITRIDGMYFPGCDLETARNFPRKGSSAEILLKEEQSLDFIWRDANNAEILSHWNAFTYGQGDMLAYRGISRVYIFPAYLTDRSDWNVKNHIEKYAGQLGPYSRTPYLFCPIGFDYVEPIPDLLKLLDRYNYKHYPRTGIWTVNAGLDDYLELIECHLDQLPVMELDPNPYWTGFYTSRPYLKKRCHDLADSLRLAEAQSLSLQNEKEITDLLSEPWWYAVTANHHDFITGTSPDRIVKEEQLPWLEQASRQVAQTLGHNRENLPIHKGSSFKATNSPEWQKGKGLIKIKTPFYTLELAESEGGRILSSWDPAAEDTLLQGPFNDLVSYYDSGGLWRMGHEYRGGALMEKAGSLKNPSSLKISERSGGLELSCEIKLDGEKNLCRIHFRNDSPFIYFRVHGRAAKGRTVTVRFNSGIKTDKLLMDQPGGMTSRPVQKIYSPTFWPFQHIFYLQAGEEKRGLLLYQKLPGAVTYREGGVVELVAFRNATREKAFGFLKLLATPASGYEQETYTFDYALCFTPPGNWQDTIKALFPAGPLDFPWDQKQHSAFKKIAHSFAEPDSPGLWVSAMKPASRGRGVILRLNSFFKLSQPVILKLYNPDFRKAFLCDARERDLQSLEIDHDRISFLMPGPIATIRLI